MKQIILSSIALSFLSYIINNEEILAVAGLKIDKNQENEIRAEIEKLSITDPRLDPTKYCNSDKCTPTMRPLPEGKLELERRANALNMATKVDGTDELLITTIMTKLTTVQRIRLAQKFKKAFNKNLEVVTKSELSGKYEDSIVSIMTPLPILYAKELQKSVNADKYDPLILVEIFCTVNNFGIKSIVEFHDKLFKKSLEKELAKDTSAFSKVMLSLVKGKRVEDKTVDGKKAADDAKALNGPGAKPWKTKPLFSEIFGTRSNAHLKQVFIEYKKISSREIEDDIKKEFPGPEGAGLLDMANCIRSQYKYFANKLRQGMSHSRGAKMDLPLIRILVSRSEIDLGQIKVEYQNLHKKPLEAAIGDKIGSHYRNTLTSVVKGNAEAIQNDL